MNRKIFTALLILLVGSLFITDTGFAAWTQAKGHAYNQLTFSYYVSKNKFTTVKRRGDSRINLNPHGKAPSGDVVKISQPKFTNTKLTYYGEYGATDDLTVFIAVPYVWTRSDDNIRFAGNGGATGVGDIDAGLRYKLSNNLFGTGILMSAQTTLKIPEAYDYDNPLEFLSLGDGQYDWTLAILFGKGIGKGYIVANAGYKIRFENADLVFDNKDLHSYKPSDQIKVRLDGGYAIAPKLSLRASIDWTKAVGNASVSDELIAANTFYGGLDVDQENAIIKDTLGLEPEVLNLGVGLAYDFAPKMSVVASYNIDVEGFWIFESANAGQGETYSLALVYMF